MTTTRRQFMGHSAAALAGLMASAPSVLKGARRRFNPARAYWAALKHPGRKVPILDSEIDLENLAEWSEFCAEKNLVYECRDDYSGKTTYDVLTEIAAAGRATPQAWEKWGVSVDTGRQQPIQQLVPGSYRRVRVLPVSTLNDPDRVKWAQHRDNRRKYAYEIDLPIEGLLARKADRIFVALDAPDGLDAHLDAIVVGVEVINYPLVRITVLNW